MIDQSGCVMGESLGWKKALHHADPAREGQIRRRNSIAASGWQGEWGKVRGRRRNRM